MGESDSYKHGTFTHDLTTDLHTVFGLKKNVAH